VAQKNVNNAAPGKGRPVASQIVTYRVDESTTARFEIDPTEGFRPAGPDQVLGWVKEAVTPAVEAAKAVLEKVKEARPDQVELKFGVKVSGGTNWLVAKAAGEGNFEVTLLWSRDARHAKANLG
jgi:Trypsin-co-occurring domain 1